MAVYGPGCHPQNIIWTEAKLICQDGMFFVIVYLRPKMSSDKIRKKTLTGSLTKTNRDNMNVKYNILQYFPIIPI